MLVRTQIQLTDTQLVALRELGSQEHRSMAELVRDGVDLYLGRARMRERAAFLEPSAALAMMDRDDARHQEASAAWAAALERGIPIVTSDYALAEACRMIQQKLGLAALKTFLEDMRPRMQVNPLTPQDYALALEFLAMVNDPGINVAHYLHFQCMRRHDIHTMLAPAQEYLERGVEAMSLEAEPRS